MNMSSRIPSRDWRRRAGGQSSCLTQFLLACCLLQPLGNEVHAAGAEDGLPLVSTHHPERILVMPKADANMASLPSFHAARRVKRLQTFPGVGGLQVLQLPPGETVASLIAKYQESGLVEYAEPDYSRTLALSPNDPNYANGALWGLHNTGQGGGTPDADIDAPEAWDVLTDAGNIVVATLDTGIRRTHEDLAANVWTNASGYGWNALASTSAPADDEGHGTLVAGILGGVGNNGKGVAGVAWRVQIMACKCFNGQRVGYDSDIIACLEFARSNGARVINASLGGAGFSHSLSNALWHAREAGIILVASAGNDAINVDLQPQYPACYDLDNVVSVAASTRTDALWGLSNFGATNVDLAAPGHQITSTFFINDSFYLSASGTSLAAPHVSGAIALMLAKYPAETHQQIIARVLNAVDPLPSLAGKCATGGRLNLRNALSPPIRLTPLPLAIGAPFRLLLAGGPNRTCVIEASTNLTSWMPVWTNATSASGDFEFTDPESGNPPHRYYRAFAMP